MLVVSNVSDMLKAIGMNRQFHVYADDLIKSFLFNQSFEFPQIA